MVNISPLKSHNLIPDTSHRRVASGITGHRIHPTIAVMTVRTSVAMVMIIWSRAIRTTSARTATKGPKKNITTRDTIAITAIATGTIAMRGDTILTSEGDPWNAVHLRIRELITRVVGLPGVAPDTTGITRAAGTILEIAITGGIIMEIGTRGNGTRALDSVTLKPERLR